MNTAMNQDDKKRRAAEAALAYVQDGSVIGVGTGSTVNFFIEALAALRRRIAGAGQSRDGVARNDGGGGARTGVQSEADFR